MQNIDAVINEFLRQALVVNRSSRLGEIDPDSSSILGFVRCKLIGGETLIAQFMAALQGFRRNDSEYFQASQQR